MAIIYTDTASIQILNVVTVTSQTASFSYLSGSITTYGGLTGSLQGTASYATQALSASYVRNYVLTSATGSMLSPYVLTTSTASMTVLSSSFATSASFATSSSRAVSSSFAATASYVLNAISASYAPYTTGTLAAAQARRTTSYTLTATPVLITFNTTDTENQPAVVSHDNVNTDRIYVYSDGLYSIHYHCDVAQGTTTNDFEFAVTKNTLTILSGSLIAGKNSSTDKMTVGITSQEILAANDYVSLAARYVASSGGVVNNAVLSVTKMEGVAGPQGATGATGAPGGVTSITAGTNVTISPAGGIGAVTINSNISSYTGSAVITGSLTVTGSVIATLGFTGSLFGTSSWSNNAVTSSYIVTAQTASYVLQAVSASFATSASNAVSASWAPGSTATTPGGTTTQIQYNNAGAFGGATNVGINTNNLQLVSTTDPTAPSAGNLLVYSRTIAGRPVAKVLNSVGLSYPLQSAFWQNTQYTWTTTGATNGLWTHTAGAGAGTFASTLPTTTNIFTSQKRSRYSNVITTANQVLGQRNTDAVFYRGAASGQGGFFFYARLGFDTWTNGSRFFAGMATATTVISADPSALNNTVGFAVDVADNGVINFLTRDATTATKQSTGLTIVSNKGYDVFIFCKPNDTVVYYRILDVVAGTEYTNSATLTLPVNTTLLTANVLASNGALTPVNSTQLSVSKIYIETEY